MGLIDSPENGATEIPGTSNDSLFVFLAGPIRHWWSLPDVSGKDQYFNHREIAHQVLSEDFLVYSPHRAWRGPWNEVAQQVNDHALGLCHAFVYLHVPGIVASGTEAECALANELGIPVLKISTGAFWTSLNVTMNRLHQINKDRIKNEQNQNV